MTDTRKFTHISQYGPVKGHLYRMLDLNGDGTGGKNANGNYSVTSDVFYIQPPAGSVYRLTEMLITVRDASGMNAGVYGSLLAALTNGVAVKMLTGASTVVYDLTVGLPIKDNAGFARLCDDVDVRAWGTGDDVLLARLTFAGPLRLVGDNDDRLEVQLNDDFTGLVEHYFTVRGYIE